MKPYEKKCEHCGKYTSTKHGKLNRGKLVRCADCRRPPPIEQAKADMLWITRSHP